MTPNEILSGEKLRMDLFDKDVPSLMIAFFNNSWLNTYVPTHGIINLRVICSVTSFVPHHDCLLCIFLLVPMVVLNAISKYLKLCTIHTKTLSLNFTLAPNLRRSLTMTGLGCSLEATYSAKTGRKGGPSSLSITRFGLAPADSSRLINSTLLGTLSATATCNGLPIIGELEFTFAPAQWAYNCYVLLCNDHFHSKQEHNSAPRGIKSERLNVSFTHLYPLSLSHVNRCDSFHQIELHSKQYLMLPK